MGFYARSRYRIGQFWRGLTAEVTPDDHIQAKQVLTPPAYSRFCQLPLDAQRHSFAVLEAIHRRGIHNPDLDAAALLHDIGKLAASEGGMPISLWVRGPLTLLEAVAPERLNAMASRNPRHGWRYAVYVYLEHPIIGAEWAAHDGCSELTCWLIRHHQDEPDETNIGPQVERKTMLLQALQAADNAS